jgi:hypothetical protein
MDVSHIFIFALGEHKYDLLHFPFCFEFFFLVHVPYVINEGHGSLLDFCFCLWVGYKCFASCVMVEK